MKPLPITGIATANVVRNQISKFQFNLLVWCGATFGLPEKPQLLARWPKD